LNVIKNKVTTLHKINGKEKTQYTNKNDIVNADKINLSTIYLDKSLSRASSFPNFQNSKISNVTSKSEMIKHIEKEQTLEHFISPFNNMKMEQKVFKSGNQTSKYFIILFL